MDIRALNFIKESRRLTFRKYFRSGLRSHIFEVLDPGAIQKETRGEVVEGIRLFPRARPKKMFRILRTRFKTQEAVFQEIGKYKLLLSFLGPDFIARSEEFMATDTAVTPHQIVLCGLQEFVEGQILDPWRLSDHPLADLFTAMPDTHVARELFICQATGNIRTFVQKIKQMIRKSGYIPDLAGIGNLIITRDGKIKLVDINNIVPVNLDATIYLDDRQYPSCDVSVEVLSILEQDILEQPISMDEPLYRFFLAPGRKKRVKGVENAFYARMTENPQV